MLEFNGRFFERNRWPVKADEIGLKEEVAAYYAANPAAAAEAAAASAAKWAALGSMASSSTAMTETGFCEEAQKAGSNRWARSFFFNPTVDITSYKRRSTASNCA